MKKYEFTEETINFYGRTLHRIRALKDFSDVKAGDLGGYIEKEENLSHKDDCWVYDNARVYGYAEVCGNAEVYGYAEVCGNAEVYGYAEVCGNAEVYGSTWDKSPLYIQGTKWSCNISSDDTITIGCQTHTFKQWHDHYRMIAEKNGASEEEIVEYVDYINLICKRYGKDEFIIKDV